MKGNCLFFDSPIMFLENGVRVNASKTERIDSGPPGSACPVNPRPSFRIDVERAFLQFEFGVRLDAVQSGRKNLVIQCQCCLYQARYS